MGDAFIRLLKRAGSDELAGWLSARGAPAFSQPEDLGERAGAAAAYVESLRLDDQERFARLERDVSRVADLAHACRQWLFRYAVARSDVEVPDEQERLGEEARWLWLFLHHEAAFEIAERRLDLQHDMNSIRRCSRFSCEPCDEVELTDAALEEFTAIVVDAFRQHDGSGKFQRRRIDCLGSEVGDELLLTFKLSRPPILDEQFDDEGRLFDWMARRRTQLQVHFNRHTGRLTVLLERGGAPMRESVANAFSKHILQSDRPPTPVPLPGFNFSAVVGLTSDQFERRPDDPAFTAEVREATLEFEPIPGSRQWVRVPSGHDLWEALAQMLSRDRCDLRDFRIVGLKVTVEFEDGMGASGRQGRSVTIDLVGDHFGNFDSSNARHVFVVEELFRRWGLEGAEDNSTPHGAA